MRLTIFRAIEDSELPSSCESEGDLSRVYSMPSPCVCLDMLQQTRTTQSGTDDGWMAPTHELIYKELVGLLEAELACPTFIMTISLGCNLFEIGSRPQFCTSCLRRIIPLQREPTQSILILCATLEARRAPAAFLNVASRMSPAQMERDRGLQLWESVTILKRWLCLGIVPQSS